MQPVRKQEAALSFVQTALPLIMWPKDNHLQQPKLFLSFFLKRKEIALKQELQEEIKYAFRTLRIQVYLTSCLYSSGKTSDNLSHTQNRENFITQYTHVPKCLFFAYHLKISFLKFHQFQNNHSTFQFSRSVFFFNQMRH